MVQEFQFTDGGQTFFCSVEAPQRAGMSPWWWCRLGDSERGTRYAPFEASPKDTKQSVQKRIIVWYADLLAIKARPVQPAYQRTWQRPARPAVEGAVVETPAPAVAAIVGEAAV